MKAASWGTRGWRSSIMWTAVLSSTVLLVASACGPRERVRASASDTPASAGAAAGAPIRIVHERSRDLTGDGAPERLRVVAEGPAFDTLTVRLEIRSAADSLLYLDRWNSLFYFRYDPRAGKPDSTVERIVRGHVARVLSDTAFARRGGADPQDRPEPVNAEAVRYDLSEHDWRRRQGVPDTVPLPPGYLDRMPLLAPDAPRVRRVVAELRDQPTFTYYAGGEITYTLAWSDRERRFVRVFACC